VSEAKGTKTKDGNTRQQRRARSLLSLPVLYALTKASPKRFPQGRGEKEGGGGGMDGERETEGGGKGEPEREERKRENGRERG